ncbi:MAG: HEAT repeat domain-containing protein [Phycisphaerae bacterium]|nr:HEAT repeat domain-containing protein [Phycisphaerae bacterium]
MKVWTFSVLSTFILSAGCTINQTALSGPDTPPVDLSSLDNKAVRIVRDALSDEHGLMRMHAVEVVATTGRRDLMPKVLSLLSDPHVAVRFAAAAAVGDMRYSAGEYSVKPMIEDPDVNVRIAAAYAMARLGKAEYAEWISNAAKNPDPTVRANAVLLLGKLGDTKYLPKVYEAMYDVESTDKVRFQAVESIAMLKDQKIYKDRLWALLISKFADDRVMGIRGMAALGTTEAKDAILTMLADEVPEVRLCAAEQLGRIGNQAGEAEVVAYFEQGRPDLNQTSVANTFAAMAIGRIGTEPLKKYLPALLQSNSKIIQLSTAQSVLLLSRQ